MKKILLVDDKPENLYLLDTLLSDKGFSVSLAENGEQALELARKNPPDMIVADVLMPIMDGFELCHKVKTDTKLKKTAFVFYTASYLDKRDEKLALSLGVDRYLLKPQEPEVLLNVFNEVLNEYDSGKNIGVIPFPDEKDYLRDHGESLVRMLEKKIEELNKSQQILEKEILARRTTELKLKASLLEKDVLLKEIYHRTKNNMQVIVGLFDLQSRKMGNQPADQVFREMSNRIYSMSMVHDLLYRSKNLYELKLDQYLEKLSDRLLALHETTETEISIALKVSSVSMNIQFAVPLGLVVNEILSNAFKYAFPDQSDGLISIEAHSEESGGLVMKISDNGIGLSDSFNILNNETLGMHIIRTVVENQLFGEISIDSTDGLAYTLILPDLLHDN